MRSLALMLLCSLLFMAAPTYAQFPKIQTPKVKKPEVKEPSIKPTAASATKGKNAASDVKDQANGAPAQDSNDPVYKAYTGAKNYLRSAESAINSTDWKLDRANTNDEIVEKLAQAREKLDFLSEQGEAEKQYWKDLHQQHQAINQRREREAAEFLKVKAYKDKLEAYYNWAVMGREIQNPELPATYTAYYAMRDEFVAQHPKEANGDYQQKQINAVNDFFNTGVIKYLTSIEKSVDKVIKESHKPMTTGEESYTLNADNYLEDLKPLEAILARYSEELFEDKTAVQAVQAKLNKEKAMLEQYINSGQLKATQEKYAEQVINERRLRPNKMTDAEVVAFVKKNLEAKYGNALQVNIIYNNWAVEKTSAGIPKYKYVKVDIAAKKDDGKCYFVKATVGRTYEGGGNYGGLYLNVHYTQGEMNCANVE